MEFQLRIEPKARKEFEKIPDRFKLRIEVAFAVLRNSPYAGKKLKGRYKGSYSWRVWPYRIVYRIYNSHVLIVIIGIKHRQGAYS